MENEYKIMEESLIAVADSGIEIRYGVFERFFGAYPERRSIFISLDASSRRMTDETLEMMLGLAKEEQNWVWPLVAELNFTHRSYGALPMAEYDAWIAMVIDEMAALAGDAWSSEADAAWRRQAERLKVLIVEAREGWDRAMPGHVMG